MELAYELAK